MKEIIVRFCPDPPVSKENCMMRNVFLRSVLRNATLYMEGTLCQLMFMALANSKGDVIKSLHVSA